MKICPKCHEEVEDSFEICWNCNYSFPDDKILDLSAVEEADDSGRSIDCLRCQVKMIYSGKYEFHEGMNTGVFGNLFELFQNREAFDLYVTAPWGFESDNSFLNAAVCIETELLPLEVLQKTQEIERELGRTHKSTGGVYSDRLIDIDLLMYDDLILSATSPSGAELNLPHPLMAERDFVMKPMAEIAPELVHPVLGKTMSLLLSLLIGDKLRCI